MYYDIEKLKVWKKGDFRHFWDPFWGFTLSSEFMIIEFHYNLFGPKIMKCKDPPMQQLCAAMMSWVRGWVELVVY